MITDIPEECEDTPENAEKFHAHAMWCMETWRTADDPQARLQMAWCEETRAAMMAERLGLEYSAKVLAESAVEIRGVYARVFCKNVEKPIEREAVR